jgi:hypothetical protein
MGVNLLFASIQAGVKNIPAFHYVYLKLYLIKHTDKWILRRSMRLRKSDMSAVCWSEFNTLLAPCDCNKMELPCRVGSLFLGERIWTYIIKLFVHY